MPISLPLSRFAASLDASRRRAVSLREGLVIALAVVLAHAWFLRHAGFAAPGAESRVRTAALQVRAHQPGAEPPAPVAPSVGMAKPESPAPRPVRMTPKPVREPARVAQVAPAPPDTRGAAPAGGMPAPSPPATSHREVAGGALDAAHIAEAPPIYPTSMPQPFVQRYEVRRGALVGRAELDWRPAGDAYEARLSASLGDAKWLEWISRGGFDAAGIAPLRFTDQRRGRAALAANFLRPAGGAGAISYSGPAVRHVLHAGTQDRLSWIVQLSAIAQGGTALASGASISMVVSGARGEVDVWSFKVAGHELIDCAGDRVPAIKLLREPRRPYDTQVEIWLDPAHEHLPARLRYSTPAGGDALEFVLQRP